MVSNSFIEIVKKALADPEFFIGLLDGRSNFLLDKQFPLKIEEREILNQLSQSELKLLFSIIQKNNFTMGSASFFEAALCKSAVDDEFMQNFLKYRSFFLQSQGIKISFDESKLIDSIPESSLVQAIKLIQKNEAFPFSECLSIFAIVAILSLIMGAIVFTGRSWGHTLFD